MPATQYEPKFTPEEAHRFASLMAGFDTGSVSDAEAIGKGRLMRRMAVSKGLRLVDVFELPEIRTALDEQMQPVRGANADSAEADELRGKLALVVPKVRELTEALTREKELTADLRGQLAVRNGAGSGAAAPSFGAQVPWLFEMAAFVAALVLIVMAAFR